MRPILRGDRLQRDRGGALLAQQGARGGDRGGAAFARATGVYGVVKHIDIYVSYSHFRIQLSLEWFDDRRKRDPPSDTGRPDHHPARPPLRARRGDPALVAWRRPDATALYNALSATFPMGEAFFVESVRAFRDGADAELAEEIKAFTTQEVIHSREHLAFNRRAADAGLRPDQARGAGRRSGSR